MEELRQCLEEEQHRLEEEQEEYKREEHRILGLPILALLSTDQTTLSTLLRELLSIPEWEELQERHRVTTRHHLESRQLKRLALQLTEEEETEHLSEELQTMEVKHRILDELLQEEEVELQLTEEEGRLRTELKTVVTWELRLLPRFQLLLPQRTVVGEVGKKMNGEQVLQAHQLQQLM